MCNALTILGAGIQLAGAAQQDKSLRRQADQVMTDAEEQAALEEDNAKYMAHQIRLQGERARGETLAGVAASGAKIGEGSALAAERQVIQNTEEDAMMAILNGSRTAESIRKDGRRARDEIRDRRKALRISTFSSLLSSGAQGLAASGGTSFKGWDFGGFNGSNDRGGFSMGNSMDWWLRNGKSGD